MLHVLHCGQQGPLYWLHVCKQEGLLLHVPPAGGISGWIAMLCHAAVVGHNRGQGCVLTLMR